MAWTPFKELNDVLRLLVDSIDEVLGDNVAAIYLQGSFAVGDADENSDVDFIVLLHRPLSDEDINQLNVMHHVVYATDNEWAKHLEGSYFTIDELHAEPGAPVWYLDHGHTTLEKSNHCNTYVVRWILQHHGIPLSDATQIPPPRVGEVSRSAGGGESVTLPQVTREDLRREMGKALLDWGKEILDNPEAYDNRFYQGFIVLNFCRMLRDIEKGEIGSKKQGAEWGKKNLPAKYHDLIDRAWLTRPNPSISFRTPANPEDLSNTLDLVRHAMNLARK